MAALVKLVNRLSPPLRETLENAVGEAMKRIHQEKSVSSLFQ